MDNEEPIVWHEPILDEYWNRLEAKMNQLDIDTKIERINFENVEITKERMAALVAIFRSGRATNSEFKYNVLFLQRQPLCRWHHIAFGVSRC